MTVRHFFSFFFHRAHSGPIRAINGGRPANDQAQNIIWLKTQICATLLEEKWPFPRSELIYLPMVRSWIISFCIVIGEKYENTNLCLWRHAFVTRILYSSCFIQSLCRNISFCYRWVNNNSLCFEGRLTSPLGVWDTDQVKLRAHGHDADHTLRANRVLHRLVRWTTSIDHPDWSMKFPAGRLMHRHFSSAPSKWQRVRPPIRTFFLICH